MTDKICDYCGKEGKYYLPSVNKWCCENSHNKCSENKNKNRIKHLGIKRPQHIADMLRIMGSYNGKNMSSETKEKLRIAGYKRKHTEEEKQKISLSHKGKVVKEETRVKIREANKWKIGSLNSNWKGGISYEPYCEIWVDKEYKNYIKERDGNKCLNPYCISNCSKLHIHHIDYNKKNCKPNNLITICNSCNSKANKDREWHTTWYKAILFRRYNLK